MDISSNYGKIRLPKINWIDSSDANVKMSIGSIDMTNLGFQGEFQMVTGSGKLSVSGDVNFNDKTDHHIEGHVGKGNSTLISKNYQGDINVVFS